MDGAKDSTIGILSQSTMKKSPSIELNPFKTVLIPVILLG